MKSTTIEKAPEQAGPPDSVNSCCRYTSFALFAVVVLAAAVVFLLQPHRPAPDSRILKSSGRIECEESRIASVVSGRISTVMIREGDRVCKGQTLITLDDQLLRPAMHEADRGVNTAAKLLAKAEAQTGSLKQQIAKVEQQSTILKEQSSQVLVQEKSSLPASAEMPATSTAPEPAPKGSKPMRLLTAPARLLLKPFAALNPAHGMKEQIAKAQENAAQMQKAMQTQMQNALKTQAKTQARLQAQMQLRSMGLMLSQASSQVLMAQAELDKIKTQKEQLEKKSKQFKIASPADGICTTCAVANGDVISAGHILMTIRDPKKTYMRAFVPEGQIARIKIGEAATVILDSNQQKRHLKAHVISIDEAPSFTPENVYFQDDRVRQVFGIKMRIDNPDGSAKPGMPCDAEIDTKESKS